MDARTTTKTPKTPARRTKVRPAPTKPVGHADPFSVALEEVRASRRALAAYRFVLANLNILAPSEVTECLDPDADGWLTDKHVVGLATDLHALQLEDDGEDHPRDMCFLCGDP